MIEAAYDRIAAAIRHGRGSRLIAVLVPPEIPLIPAAEKLRSHLLGRGIMVRPVRLARHASLLEAVEEVDPRPSEVVIVYGLEALSQSAREAFLRTSSFARTRLQGSPVAVILVLGTETWSWLGMELPDLARWADGPFLVSDGGKGIDLRAPRPRLGRTPIVDSSVVLDDCRNVDIQTVINDWIDRRGLLIIGGPRGVGVTHLAVRLEARLSKQGKITACTENPSLVNGVPVVGGSDLVGDPDVPLPKSWTPLRLEDWLSGHRDEIVFVSREFWPIVPISMTARTGMTGVVLGPSSAAIQPSVGARLYVPPVQVIEVDGSEHARGINRMVDAVLDDAAHQLQFPIETFLPRDLLSTLAYGSGGLPGVLWSLIIQTLQRALRIGSPAVTPEIIEGVVSDVARSRPPVPEDLVVSAIQNNSLDFELESRGAVLFYVIDGTLRTLRHPLSILAERLRTDSKNTRVKPTRASRRRRRPPHDD